MKRVVAALTCALTLAACGVDPEAALTESEQDTELETSQSALAAPSLLAWSSPVDLIASTGNLYWTAYGIDEFGPDSASVWRASKSNTPGSEILLYKETGDQANFYYFGSLTYANVGGNWFGYFIANYTASGGGTSQIKRIPLTGGSATLMATSPAFVAGRDLTTDGSFLYWADAQGLRRMPIGGGAITTLFASANLQRVELDANSLYFTEGATVRKMAKTGGIAQTVVTDSSNITALKAYVSGATTTLYFGTQAGAVKSWRAGANVSTHQSATAGRSTTSVEFDGRRVTWTDCVYPNGNSCRVRRKDFLFTTTISSGSVGARNLQSDSASIYWGDVSGVKKFVH